MIDRLHHIGIVVPSADEALGFYRDVMGLDVAVDEVVEEQGVRGVLMPIGENEIELLEPVREDTGVARFLESRGPTMHHFCFSTDDIHAELDRLKALDVQLIDEEPRYGLAGQIAFIHPAAMHGVLVELAQPRPEAQGGTGKGFDRLTCRVADYETARARWHEVVGLEERHRFDLGAEGLIIGQLGISETLIELLAPSGPNSPLTKVVAEEGERAFSAVALEVADLDAEIARYRAAGITMPDPEPGHLPGSRRSRISEDQAFGLGIQLIQY